MIRPIDNSAFDGLSRALQALATGKPVDLEGVDGKVAAIASDLVDGKGGQVTLNPTRRGEHYSHCSSAGPGTTHTSHTNGDLEIRPKDSATT